MNSLKAFISQFGEINFPYENIFIHRKKYYLQTKELKNVLESINEEALRFGLLIGEEKGKFIASTPLLSLISQQTTKKIILDEKPSWLFSCGRDIFAKQISNDKSFKNNEVVIVTNKFDEVLGLAIKTKDKKFSKDKFKNKKTETEHIYKNILDIGDYLRREQKR